MKSFKQISCILTHLEKDNVFRSEWRLDTRSNNHWKRWLLYKQTVRDPRVSHRCFRCDHRRQRRRFLGSLYSWQFRPKLCLCHERQRTTTYPHPAQESFCTQQVVASLQGVGGHSPILLTRRSMFSARPKTPVQSRAYWIFLLFFRRAFFALKYAVGTTGFTVILRATGRICALFNEIFVLTFATVYTLVSITIIENSSVRFINERNRSDQAYSSGREG